jgi:hypothetical protein
MRRDHKATHPFLETPKFAGSQRVGLANDGDHVNTWREAAHQLNVNLPQPKHHNEPPCQTLHKVRRRNRTYACPVGEMK